MYLLKILGPDDYVLTELHQTNKIEYNNNFSN